MVDFIKNAPLIMGIVNVTPDSFSDGGQYFDTDKAVNHALALLEEGADILDIGGESTRPGAEPVSIEEEQKRVLPVIKMIKARAPSAVISVDTRHAITMEKSIDLGANIVNDVSALTHDVQSLNVVVKTQIPVILMHMKGTPQTMQHAPNYLDVVQEVYDYLLQRIKACLQAGVVQNNIIIDVGLGFGKTLEDNLTLLKNIDKFHSLGCPILLGASRKRFIEKICPNTPADKRVNGSVACALMALEKGVQVFRVHDVAETKQAFKVWQAIQDC